MDDILKEIEKAADDIQIPASLDPNNVKKKLKERNGLTEDLKNKIDIFFATGRITEEQYNDLMDIGNEEIR